MKDALDIHAMVKRDTLQRFISRSQLRTFADDPLPEVLAAKLAHDLHALGYTEAEQLASVASDDATRIGLAQAHRAQLAAAAARCKRDKTCACIGRGDCPPPAAPAEAERRLAEDGGERSDEPAPQQLPTPRELPPGWQRVRASDYYFNKKTGFASFRYPGAPAGHSSHDELWECYGTGELLRSAAQISIAPKCMCEGVST